MNRILGRFLNNRLVEAGKALANLEQKMLELRIAMQTCEDDFVRAQLNENLGDLVRRMVSIAEATQTDLQSDPFR